jgi:hypothetical protein
MDLKDHHTQAPITVFGKSEVGYYVPSDSNLCDLETIGGPS